MATAERDPKAEFQPGRGYEQSDWEAASESPDLTEAERASLRPAREVLPASFFEGLEPAREERRRGRGRPKAEAGAKVAVTLRLEPAVVEGFKAQGGDWRQRMQEALGQAVRGAAGASEG